MADCYRKKLRLCVDACERRLRLDTLQRGCTGRRLRVDRMLHQRLVRLGQRLHQKHKLRKIDFVVLIEVELLHERRETTGGGISVQQNQQLS